MDRFEDDPMLTMTEAADVAGVSRSTLYAKVKAGELSRTPGGTLDPAELRRVFGELQGPGQQQGEEADAAAVPATDAVAGDAGVLAEHVAWLRELVDAQRAALERKDRELHEAATRLHDAEERAERREATWLRQLDALTTKLLPAPGSSPAPPRSFLRRVFGG